MYLSSCVAARLEIDVAGPAAFLASGTSIFWIQNGRWL